MGIIDVHAHYDGYLTKEMLQTVPHVTAIILNGMDQETNERAVSFSGGSIKAACGYHPLHITTQDQLEQAKKTSTWIASHANSIVAIGEIGLDYFHVKDPHSQQIQREGFLLYLSLAQKLQKPIIVHTRNAVVDILTMLESFKGTVILHCLEASEKNILEAVRRKYFFSIPPAIIRNELFQRIVMLAPMSQLLTETDAPYQGPVKGVFAKPEDVAIAVREIARIKKLDEHEVSLMILQNYKRVFG